MFEKRTLNIYSITIGILFIISGLGKVIDTSGFSDLISQYGLGYLMILSPLIVVFEILLGLFLVLLVNPKFYAMVSFFLLTMFTMLFAFAHFKYGVNNCGCFGTIQHTNLPPVFSFIRNFILIAASIIVWIKYPKEKTEITKWKKYPIFILMSISIFIAGFTFKTPYFFKDKSKINKFQNQNIKNTDLAKYVKTSPDSTYLIFCFSYGCPHCWNSIENLRQYKITNTANIIALGVGEKNKKDFNDNFKPDFAIKNISVNEMDKLTDVYPTSFYISHDTIKTIIISGLPSPFVFKNLYYLSKNKN